jgi:hypothetical protein
MHKLPIITQTMAPTTITVEASLEVILRQDLDRFAGEQYDQLEGVISIEVTRDTVTFETARTFEAYRRGAPNAGRGTWTFQRADLAALWAPTVTQEA